MNKNVNYLLALFAALMLTSLTACGPSGDKSTTAAGTDNTAMSDNSTAGSTDSAMSGSAAGTAAEIIITNPMPHEMIISADIGQGSKELGSVKSSETKTFDIDAPVGTAVNLVATDAGHTHSPTVTLTIEAGHPATWTIQ